MKKFLCAVLSCCFLLSVVHLPAYSYGTQNYEDFSEYKSKYRILYGILLVVGGGFLAYDGFRTVKNDISRPSTSIELQSRWNTMVSSTSVFIQSRGTVTNTGNVTLRNVTFDIRYKSTAWESGYYYPAQITSPYPQTVGDHANFGPGAGLGAGTPLPALESGDVSSWKAQNSYTFAQAGGNPPDGTRGADNDPNGTDNWFPTSADPYTYAEVVNLKYTWDKKYETKMNNAFEGVAGVLLFGAGAYLLIDYIVSLNKFEYYMKKHSMDVYVQNSSDEFWIVFSKRM